MQSHCPILFHYQKIAILMHSSQMKSIFTCLIITCGFPFVRATYTNTDYKELAPKIVELERLNKQFIPFDDNFLNFCLKNQTVQGVWNHSILFFLLNYYSNKIDSFDGPFEENVDFDTIKEHLKTLNIFNKRRLKIKLGQSTGVEGTRLYEFPDPTTQFIKNSFVITDRTIPSLGLLFEDKLKIYGV